MPRHGTDGGIGSGPALPTILYSDLLGAMLSTELSDLLAKKFIARPDVKAIQFSDGSWAPHTETRKHDGPRIPWKRADLEAHLSGQQTFGHYMLSQANQCKLFAFDIDFEKTGFWPEFCTTPEVCGKECDPKVFEFNPREAWLDRAHPARSWQKYQLKTLASQFMKAIWSELEIPSAAAYSGGKGVHVYGFTGLIEAADVREGARIVLDAVGGWTPSRGDNFFRSTEMDAVTGYPNFSIEVFPKQDNLDGKDLGNLMRMPLGRNLKSTDPTFFIDMRTPMSVMAPVDPVWALSTQNPWADS